VVDNFLEQILHWFSLTSFWFPLNSSVLSIFEF
jgi:hypothetical protein